MNLAYWLCLFAGVYFGVVAYVVWFLRRQDQDKAAIEHWLDTNIRNRSRDDR